MENGLADTVGEGEGGMSRDSGPDIVPTCAHCPGKQTAGGRLPCGPGSSAQCSVAAQRLGWIGRRLKSEGLYMFTDS